MNPAQLPDPALPLFPLRSVLFPGGVLALRVFEARYLDLVAGCLREQRPFGVVCLNQGSEVRQHGDETPRFEHVGTLAEVLDVDADTPGLLHLRCRGGARFEWQQTHQAADGLWWADRPTLVPDDAVLPPGPELQPAADALGRVLVALDLRQPGVMPHERQLDSAGWVANRWCELLPIPLAARQQLMALTDPLLRLQLVSEVLRAQKLI